MVHRSNESQHLKSIIERISKLEVCEPEDCEPLRANCLYLARPDRHMMMGENHVHLRHGPKENNFRPAIDPLFRSLAVFGSSEEKMGELTPYNCPDCNGVLWEIEDGPLTRYRCHTGHAYTSRALEQQQDEMLERSLFDSLRACRERVNFVRNLAEIKSDKTEIWSKKLEVYERDCALLEAPIKDRSSARLDL